MGLRVKILPGWTHFKAIIIKYSITYKAINKGCNPQHLLWPSTYVWWILDVTGELACSWLLQFTHKVTNLLQVWRLRPQVNQNLWQPWHVTSSVCCCIFVIVNEVKARRPRKKWDTSHGELYSAAQIIISKLCIHVQGCR